MNTLENPQEYNPGLQKFLEELYEKYTRKLSDNHTDNDIHARKVMARDDIYYYNTLTDQAFNSIDDTSGLKLGQIQHLIALFSNVEELPEIKVIEGWLQQGKSIHVTLSHFPRQTGYEAILYVYDEETQTGNFYDIYGSILPWNQWETIDTNVTMARVDYPRKIKEISGNGGKEPKKLFPLMGLFFEECLNENGEIRWKILSTATKQDSHQQSGSSKFGVYPAQIIFHTDNSSIRGNFQQIHVNTLFKAVYGLNGNMGRIRVVSEDNCMYSIHIQEHQDLEQGLEYVGGNDHYTSQGIQSVMLQCEPEYDPHEFHIVQEAELFGPKSIQLLGENIGKKELHELLAHTRDFVRVNLEFCPPITTYEELESFLGTFRSPYPAYSDKNLKTLLRNLGVNCTIDLQETIPHKDSKAYFIHTTQYGSYILGLDGLVKVDIFVAASNLRNTPENIRCNSYYESLAKAKQVISEFLFPSEYKQASTETLVKIVQSEIATTANGFQDEDDIQKKLLSAFALLQRGEYTISALLKDKIKSPRLKLMIVEITGDKTGLICSMKSLGLIKQEDLMSSSKNLVRHAYANMNNLHSISKSIGKIGKGGVDEVILENVKRPTTLLARSLDHPNGLELYCEVLLQHLQKIAWIQPDNSQIKEIPKVIGNIRSFTRWVRLNIINNQEHFLMRGAGNIEEYREYINFCLEKLETGCTYLQNNHLNS